MDMREHGRVLLQPEELQSARPRHPRRPFDSTISRSATDRAGRKASARYSRVSVFRKMKMDRVTAARSQFVA
jgi:hypothetical protein